MLLRELLFIHLDHAADKLQLAVQMLLKLFSLVGCQGLQGDGWVPRSCCGLLSASDALDVLAPGACWQGCSVSCLERQ